MYTIAVFSSIHSGSTEQRDTHVEDEMAEGCSAPPDESV